MLLSPQLVNVGCHCSRFVSHLLLGDMNFTEVDTKMANNLTSLSTNERGQWLKWWALPKMAVRVGFQGVVAFQAGFAMPCDLPDQPKDYSQYTGWMGSAVNRHKMLIAKDTKLFFLFQLLRAKPHFHP